MADRRKDGREDEDEGLHRAEEVVAEGESRHEDPDTIREAIEQELDEEGLSEEGGTVGEHIE